MPIDLSPTPLLRRILLPTLLLAGSLVALKANPRVVKVGVFPNAPAVFMGEDGIARGFYPDMLREAAAKEGWELQFVPGTWQEGLDRIRFGEISLLSMVARTPERVGLSGPWRRALLHRLESSLCPPEVRNRVRA